MRRSPGNHFSIKQSCLEFPDPPVDRRSAPLGVCIVDGKRHMREFIEEALDESGFATRGCARVGGLSAMFEGRESTSLSQSFPWCLDFCTIGEANGAM